MSRPQQPEIARSGRTDVDPDHVGEALEGARSPKTKGKTGPVPPENQPGHHPPEEQDKPDLDAFAARLTASDAKEAEAAATERTERQRNAGERENMRESSPAEPPYMHWALYPVRLVTHAAKWSREYFEAGRR